MGIGSFLPRYKDLLLKAPYAGKDLTGLFEEKYSKKKSQQQVRDSELVIEASTMEEAFVLAAKKLGVDITHLHYRVLDAGGGLMRNKVKVVFTKGSPRPLTEEGFPPEDFDFDLPDAVNVDRDGVAELDVTRKGKFLIVKAPIGNGKPISTEQIGAMLRGKGIATFDREVIEVLAKKRDGKPFFLGDWIPSTRNDGKLFLEFSDDKMKVMARILEPKADGRYIDKEDIKEALDRAHVVFGIKQEKIEELLSKRIFGVPFSIVEGNPCVHGKDAEVSYKVVIREKVEFDSNADQIDFHELDLIVNVMADEILIEKIPVTKGVEGIDVFGERVEPRVGKNVVLEGGDNTVVTEDGLYLKSKINGHVIKVKGLLAVKDVYEIVGDVGPSTGNITNMGSVVVKGSILDGYNVKAAGNIEVHQNIGNCLVEATGDIIVKMGVTGKGKATIRSLAGSVYAKYIQDANVEVAENVFAIENIIQSNVDAGGSVRLNGKKAGLYGGCIRALKEVEARTIGSTGGVKTTIEVGVQPSIRREYTEVAEILTTYEPTIPGLELDFKTLEQQPEDDEKEAKLAELTEKIEETKAKVEAAKERLHELEGIIASSPEIGKVIANKALLVGVTLRCNTGTLINGRDQGPSYYTVDESKPEYVKFNQLKSTKREGR